MANSKERSSGSGTTSQSRRAQRQGQQWTSLAHADPPCISSESLQEKVAALKKALTSAERQLEEALKKEAEDTEALKKAEEDLEKLTLRGKKGPRSRSQSRTRLSSAEEAAREAALKQKLTRQLSQLKLETDPSLKKEDSAPSAPSTLKKVADSSSSSSKPLKKRPCVVVDWRNALEEKDAVPHKNVVALETLMLAVDVHIISWVGSSARFEKTMQDIQQWLPAETLKKVKSFRCIYKMVGAEGKVDWACYLGAQAVFDDQPDVIQEALEWGLEGYPIKAWGKNHQGTSFWSFADAVEQYLKDRTP